MLRPLYPRRRSPLYLLDSERDMPQGQSVLYGVQTKFVALPEIEY
jgi:hypothetical protein